VRGKLLPFVLAAAPVVTLDQWTKAWIQASFQLFESRSVVDGVLRITYIRNPGAAFGIFAHGFEGFRNPFFLGVTALALAVILVVVRRLPPGRPWTAAALGLVFGGAVGNLIDRLRWGEVVDFIDVFWRNHHWPTFNVADSGITVGVAFLVLVELFGERRAKSDMKGARRSGEGTRRPRRGSGSGT
jgi:signal peptidase II